MFLQEEERGNQITLSSIQEARYSMLFRLTGAEQANRHTHHGKNSSTTLSANYGSNSVNKKRLLKTPSVFPRITTAFRSFTFERNSWKKFTPTLSFAIVSASVITSCCLTLLRFPFLTCSLAECEPHCPPVVNIDVTLDVECRQLTDNNIYNWCSGGNTETYMD